MKITPAGEKFGKTIHFYRANVGMSFQAVKNKANTHYVMNINMAKGHDSKYDWDDKHEIQITYAELPSVCAVLLGLKTGVEFKFHGQDKKHSYSVTNNKGVITFTCSRPKQKLFFTLDDKASDIEAESFWLTEFMLDRLHMNCSNMTKTDLMNLLKQTVKRSSPAA